MLDRTLAPAFQPLKVPTLARPEIQQLGNGIELTSYLDPNQNLVQVDFIFQASDLSILARQLDAYAFKMLLEGTKNRDAKKIADDISFLGASFDISHGPESDSITISCLSRFLPQMLEILKCLWEESVFPAREWKTMQETGIQQNAINEQKTSYQVGKLFRQKLFGLKTDYGYSFDKELIGAFNSNQIQAHFRAQQTLGPGLVIISGWAEKEALSILREWLSSFSGCSKLKVPVDGELVTEKSGIYWDNRPESQQTSLRLGQRTINSHHPDSPYFQLMLEIFGGYFGSRLMSNIREEKGWTYGIFAQKVGYKNAPYWFIGADLKAEVAMQALEEIKKEAAILKNELAEEEELEKVKNYMIGQFLTSITHCYGLADRYKSLWSAGRTIDNLEKSLQTIQQAEAEKVREMAQKYLHVDEAIVAFSGKNKGQ